MLLLVTILATILFAIFNTEWPYFLILTAQMIALICIPVVSLRSAYIVFKMIEETTRNLPVTKEPDKNIARLKKMINLGSLTAIAGAIVCVYQIYGDIKLVHVPWTDARNSGNPTTMSLQALGLCISVWYAWVSSPKSTSTVSTVPSPPSAGSKLTESTRAHLTPSKQSSQETEPQPLTEKYREIDGKETKEIGKSVTVEMEALNNSSTPLNSKRSSNFQPSASTETVGESQNLSENNRDGILQEVLVEIDDENISNHGADWTVN